MRLSPSYKKAFYYALTLHLSLIILLLFEPHFQSSQYSIDIQAEKQVENSHAIQTVQAVSVTAEELEQRVAELEQEKKQKLQKEQQHQQKLRQAAEKARQTRLAEERRLKKMKQEAEQIAIARKRRAEDEARKQKKLAEQRAIEQKKLAELKKEHESLKKEEEQARKQIEEKKRQDAVAQQEKEKAAREASERLAREEAANAARVAGEVDKYKALILQSISRQWILPENVDQGLASQFRIRLAPDGMVLSVNLLKSSGDSVLDRSAQTAIFKASPLPVPSDPAAFKLFRTIRLTVRPEQARG